MGECSVVVFICRNIYNFMYVERVYFLRVRKILFVFVFIIICFYLDFKLFLFVEFESIYNWSVYGI